MYIVIEMQTNDGITSTITNAYDDESLAFQKYHQILSFAAVSTVDVHTAVMMNEYGMVIRNEDFTHNSEETQE